MTEPNKELLEAGATGVILGGVIWPLRKLALKQNRVVTPLVVKLGPAFKQFSKGVKTADNLVGVVTDEMFNDLSNMVFTALTRSHPTLKRDEFDELPITIFELFQAFLPIAEQTGLFRAAKAGENPPAPVTEAGSQTGTA